MWIVSDCARIVRSFVVFIYHIPHFPLITFIHSSRESTPAVTSSVIPHAMTEPLETGDDYNDNEDDKGH